MSNTTTKLNAAAANQAVRSFQDESATMKSEITSDDQKINDVNARTTSVWVKNYAQQFDTALNTEVASAVAEIEKTAAKLQEITDAIMAEDTN